MAEVSKLRFPELGTDLEICDEKARRQIGQIAGTALVTLPVSGWSQSAPYMQKAAVPGVKAEDNVELKLYTPKSLNAQEVKLYQKQTAMITDGITEDGYVTFYCGAKKPASDFSVLLKGVKADG